MSRCLVFSALVVLPTTAFGQSADTESKVVLAPHVGVITESDLVNGSVRFSDGKIDFISIRPHGGLLIGVALGVRIKPELSGVLALSYATAGAGYIEDGNLRPDVSLHTIRLQPGVMADVVATGKASVSVGGGLTIARISIDRLVWNDVPIEPTATAVGLFGAAGIDVALSARASFHAQLALELSRAFLGDFERELARADGELGADVDRDTRTAVSLVLGVAFAL